MRELGLTTGHSPQSKPVAHMGGLVATRSIGQFSTLYGGIEDMVVGPRGRLPRRRGDAHQERPAPGRRARHPPRRDRQRRRALLHHRGHGEALPLLPREQRLPGLHAEGHEDRLRGAARRSWSTATSRRWRGSTTPATPACTSRTSPPRTTACCSSWPRGRPGSPRRRPRASRPSSPDHPECTRVDSAYIETWFNDLCWGPDKITAEDERIRQTRNVNRTTEISADWSSINDIYQAARARIIAEIPDITMMGGHSSHSYINGTNMYFNYFFNVVGVGPEEETDQVLPAHHQHHLRGDAQARRLHRPPPRHGQGAGALGQGRVRLLLLHPRDAQAGVRPARHHEQGDDLPAVSEPATETVCPECTRRADVLGVLQGDPRLRGAARGRLGRGGDARRARPRYVRRVLNCFDESALELALRLSRAADGAAAVTVEPRRAVRRRPRGRAVPEDARRARLRARGPGTRRARRRRRRDAPSRLRTGSGTADATSISPRRRRLAHRRLRAARRPQRPGPARLPQRPRRRRHRALPGRRGAGLAVPDAGDRRRAADATAACGSPARPTTGRCA